MTAGAQQTSDEPDQPRSVDSAQSRRRPPTAAEAHALAHPLRQRIVRLCTGEELTNRQLADRLESDPGTVLPHVRTLVKAGFLEPTAVRTGVSGALEKPYRATGKTWWLDDPLADAGPDLRFAPIDLAMADARAAGPEGIATYDAFTLHLTPADVVELERRVLAVLDQFVADDATRAGAPVHRGLFLLHRLPGGSGPESAAG
ncbi:MAG TPA: winged helix-turn-helix domain-containing protein [Cellulomonas sp.]